MTYKLCWLKVNTHELQGVIKIVRWDKWKNKDDSSSKVSSLTEKAQHVRKYQQWEKAWREPGPFSPSDPLTSNDSPGSPCGKVAPQRITGSEVGPPDRSSVPFCLFFFLLFTSYGLFPFPHTRKALAQTFFFVWKEGMLEGLRRSTEEEPGKGRTGS